MNKSKYILSIDQGTTSTRAVVFDVRGVPISSSQIEHKQYFPKPGWVEHDPMEIWTNTRKVVAEALATGDLHASDISALGITNQRETVVVWNRITGKPIAPAIVWQDTRTKELIEELCGGDYNLLREKTGLNFSTYFSAPKILWLLENIDGAREKAYDGEVICGTMDSWLIWCLTDGMVHATDVTNASRTMLMNIETTQWDDSLCDALRIPKKMLPNIYPSSSLSFGKVRIKDPLAGVPITGILGDQQSAMLGQGCLEEGSMKNTYGTGSFILLNTGNKISRSPSLLTTVAYQNEGEEVKYALEGSIAVTGAAVQWLRDNLGIIKSAGEIEALASKVKDNGGVYFVPAFSGLFAPYWDDTARGAILGLTRFVNSSHIARAVLEAVCYQSKDVIEVMRSSAKLPINELKVDGGMVVNELLMQIQADILGLTIIRPKIIETTSLGSAYAAGIAIGFWSLDQIKEIWSFDKDWQPQKDMEEIEASYKNWKKAINKSRGWL
jgi:glycerol kinase